MRPVGQAAKTPPSHGGNGSSILPRVTTQQRPLILSTVFVFLLCEGRQRPRNEQFPTLHVPRYRAHCPRRPALSPCTARAPALTHLHRPHPPRAHGAAPHDRPDAPLARTVLRHRRALPAPATTARLPAEVLKLQDFSFYQSISSFVVSLPNVSEKDVKGLLFRKQLLHTSPTTGAKAVELSPAFLRANVCELSHTFLRAMRASPHLHPKGESGAALLSSLGNLSSPPRRLERVESQNECSIPERFDELTLA